MAMMMMMMMMVIMEVKAMKDEKFADKRLLWEEPVLVSMGLDR